MCSFYEVGSVGQRDTRGVQCVPELVQPLNIEKQTASLKSPGLLWGPSGAFVRMHSNVSCIKKPRNYYAQATDVDPSVSHVLYPSYVHCGIVTDLLLGLIL